MKVYNTLTNKIEEFIPNDKNNVKMYTCGPTVYHYAHIGNLRTYIFEDTLEKTLKFLGYNVTRVMNITDVGHLTNDSDDGDDKMLKGARRENKSIHEIADYYTESFIKDAEELNIVMPKIVEKASNYIDKYIEMITNLLEKNIAYQAGGNIYFDTSKADNYYKLSGKKSDELMIGARDDVTLDNNKKNQSDFVLWFTDSKYENQEMRWESPFGYGYPGWHIECSGIALSNLGEYLDIHCGGIDNIFPHHENEIAQSEAILGHKWCNYWMHGEYLNDQTGKMSKSKGEFLTVSLVKEKGYNPLSYRFMCLNSHYRKGLLFTWESLEQAENTYNKVLNKIKQIEKTGEIENIESFLTEFKESLANDLNTSSAFTVLYDVLKSDLNGNSKRYLIEKMDEVLSLDLLREEKINHTINEEYINSKIALRNEAKANKNYALADQIRNELLELGIILKDSREGTTYEIK